MKEKLTLEHIAPYLPYGLKVQRKTGYNYKVKGAIGNSLYYEYDAGFGIENCKPILRPMDLTKPIKNGIIPAIEIAKFMDNGHNHTDSNFRLYSGVIIVGTGKCDDVHDVRISLSNNTIYSIKMDGNEAMFETSRRIRKWLYDNKFDIDGLIDAELAIDVNTLEINPYE